jgi:hypothetical protein
MNFKLVAGIVGGFFGTVIVLLTVGFLLMRKVGSGGCPLKSNNSMQTQPQNTATSSEDYL